MRARTHGGASLFLRSGLARTDPPGGRDLARPGVGAVTVASGRVLADPAVSGLVTGGSVVVVDPADAGRVRAGSCDRAASPTGVVPPWGPAGTWR